MGVGGNAPDGADGPPGCPCDEAILFLQQYSLKLKPVLQVVENQVDL